MKVSKKFLVKARTSMDAQILVPSKVSTPNKSKNVIANVDTPKNGMSSKASETKLVATLRHGKKASAKAKAIKKNLRLFVPINEGESSECHTKTENLPDISIKQEISEVHNKENKSEDKINSEEFLVDSTSPKISNTSPIRELSATPRKVKKTSSKNSSKALGKKVSAIPKKNKHNSWELIWDNLTEELSPKAPKNKISDKSNFTKAVVPRAKKNPYLFVPKKEDSYDDVLIKTEDPGIYIDEKNIEVNMMEENLEYDFVDPDYEMNSSDSIFQCKYCQKIYKNNSNLVRHEKLHSGIRPFACKFCDKSFTIQSQLRGHEKRHTGDLPYNCKKCNKQFLRPSVVNQHEKICPGKVDKIFKKSCIMDDEKQFSCTYCPKKFISMTSLQMHEIIHTGEKPFGCKFCDKKFNQKGNAKTHEALHYENKGIEGEFSCRFCKENFHYHHVMIRHLKIHTNGKPFDCAYCGKLWAKKSRLEPHEKSCKRRMERKNKKDNKKLTKIKINGTLAKQPKKLKLFVPTKY